MPPAMDYLRAAFRPNEETRAHVTAAADLRVLAECLGGAAAGFVAAAILTAAAIPVPSVLGVGLGLGAAMAIKASRDHARRVAERLHGHPEYQGLLAGLRHATGGPVSSRRGNAWVVFRPGEAPAVMGPAAYAAFRAAAPRLDEVVAEGDRVRLVRLAAGRPISDLDGQPAVETFDLATGLSTDRAWVIYGERLDADGAGGIPGPGR